MLEITHTLDLSCIDKIPCRSARILHVRHQTHISWTLLLTHYYTHTYHYSIRIICVTHNLGTAAMVGMAARVDIASAAVVANANSAQKITTTKVQIVGSSTGSTATKELPCTKNRKSNTPSDE